MPACKEAKNLFISTKAHPFDCAFAAIIALKAAVAVLAKAISPDTLLVPSLKSPVKTNLSSNGYVTPLMANCCGTPAAIAVAFGFAITEELGKTLDNVTKNLTPEQAIEYQKQLANLQEGGFDAKMTELGKTIQSMKDIIK